MEELTTIKRRYWEIFLCLLTEMGNIFNKIIATEKCYFLQQNIACVSNQVVMFYLYSNNYI